MFKNINKKVLIIAVVFLVLLLVGGFFTYHYFAKTKTLIPNDENSLNKQGDQQENTQNPQDQANVGISNIEIEEGNKSGLLICVDKCGDSICQKAEGQCNNFNCVCLEDKQECPQDCK